MVGGGDGGVVEGNALQQTQSESMYGSGQPGPYQVGQGKETYGNASGLPPAYTSGGGESLREKR